MASTPPGRPRLTRWLARVALFLAYALGHAGRAGAVRAGRAVGGWAGRPGGRFAVALLALIAVVIVTATAGGFGARALAPTRTPQAQAARGHAPSAPNSPVVAAPSGQPSLSPAPAPSGAGAPSRPQDALSGWANGLTAAVGISVTALQAYGYAQLAAGATTPACHLGWTTLAAIGKVESNHGTANSAVLSPDGHALPPIIGPPLDGHDGRRLIPDTDGGTLDGDRTYDHAIGPMQFLPSTWRIYGIDGDGDGAADPNDINDAALAAANYLCAGGRDLSTPTGWWGAILSYNAVAPYAQAIFAAANDYGARSRSVT